MSENKIENLLPDYNCGSCGFSSCRTFAEHLLSGDTQLNTCPLLGQQRYAGNKERIRALLLNKKSPDLGSDTIVGVLDGYKADIVLHPLPNECACREVLLPMSRIDLKAGDVITYRPLGCPVIHVARVLYTEQMLVTVHVIGPVHREGSIPVGICMVIGFEGAYTGKTVKVGDTVRFLPNHCMMQKVHSGVVINIENEQIKLEGIDLKVWALPEKEQIQEVKP